MTRYILVFLAAACGGGEPELLATRCAEPVEPHEQAFPSCSFEVCCYDYALKGDAWTECYAESSPGGVWPCEGEGCTEEEWYPAWRQCRYGSWWERADWEGT